MVVTMATVTILSGFNGVEKLVESLYNTPIDSDISITPIKGKTFNSDSIPLQQVLELPEIERSSKIIQENVLLKRDERQTIATIKGIEDDFFQFQENDSLIQDGDFALEKEGVPHGVMGSILRMEMEVSTQGIFKNQVDVYAPIRGKKISKYKERAFNKKLLLISGVFAINIDYDAQYIFVPFDYAQELFGFENEISGVELFTTQAVETEELSSQIKQILGNDFEVKTKYERNELVYQTNNAEKWFTFLILIFILMIAGFNLVASLTMLVIDKKNDGKILLSMGMTKQNLALIFTVEGILINLVGAIIGLIIGLLICVLQQEVGIIRMEGSIVPYYPVDIQWLDFVQVFIAVMVIGILFSWLPVRYLIKQHFV